jgi:uncharacterized protein
VTLTQAAADFSARIAEAGSEFVTLTLEVLPFFVIGAVTGAALQAFVPTRWVERVFGGRGQRSLYAAGAAGAVLPGCACATMPMAAGLKSGSSARLGTVAAFIFVSPLLSPVTVALTWGMLGWRMTAARVAASLLGSVLLGLAVNRFEPWFRAGLGDRSPAAPPVGAASCCGPAAGCAPSNAAPCHSDALVGDPRTAPGERSRFWSALRGILRSVTPYFLLGMLIAAGLSALLPEAAIPRFLGGSSGVWAYLLAAVVGVPLYVCEGEEVPITYALLAGGLGAGPALTFLLGSVGTCVPTILMSRSVIGRRATTFYTAFWLVFVVAAGLAFQAAN